MRVYEIHIYYFSKYTASRCCFTGARISLRHRIKQLFHATKGNDVEEEERQKEFASGVAKSPSAIETQVRVC